MKPGLDKLPEEELRRLYNNGCADDFLLNSYIELPIFRQRGQIFCRPCCAYYWHDYQTHDYEHQMAKLAGIDWKPIKRDMSIPVGNGWGKETKYE